MDLAKIDVVTVSEKGYTFKYVIDGVETDLEIDVLGAASRTFKNAMRLMTDYTETCHRNGKQPVRDIEDQKFVDVLVACTKGWRGMEEGGEPVVFSEANARRIYAAYPLLAKQVSENISNVEARLNEK